MTHFNTARINEPRKSSCSCEVAKFAKKNRCLTKYSFHLSNFASYYLSTTYKAIFEPAAEFFREIPAIGGGDLYQARVVSQLHLPYQSFPLTGDGGDYRFFRGEKRLGEAGKAL